MNYCLLCDTRLTSDECPTCHHPPAIIDGFRAFAPALAREAPGFDPSHFQTLAQLEAGNFWFKARNAVILQGFERFCSGARQYLEIGCGTGYVLSAISSRYPNLSCWGSEIFVEGLSFAASRLPDAKLLQMDARRIPFAGYFDAIGAFDVLEHIEEDTDVLHEIHRALVPGGHVLITVPQHRWLWSAQDDFAHHVRRYRPGELDQKLLESGFRVRWSTSFVTLLLPALMLSRLIKRDAGKIRDPFAEFRIPRGLDALMLKVMQIECAMIRAGANLPVGGTRIVVAEKLA